MSGSAIQLLLFTAKTLIIVLFILLLIAGILALFSNGKQKTGGKIQIKNLNKKFAETTETLLGEILSKKQYKQFSKEQKTLEKMRNKEDTDPRNVFVLNFDGDIKASAVEGLREEVTAILGIAKPHDEVVVCVESGGGMVHAYGLAAAQLQRIRNNHIPLTVTVDKVAASGGYLMASVANKILAAPFAIIGSIGVVVQIPNFYRLLKEKKIDFEQLTAGNFKRTLTLFGHNTEEGREKLQEEIEDIHRYFKEVIQHNRTNLDIDKVATGEHWLGSQALELKLVDELITSDDYLLKRSKEADVYTISYSTKKSLLNRLMTSASILSRKLLERSSIVGI